MKIKLILCILPMIFLTGCYNYNELNTLAIATGLSIDYKDDEYEVAILIANSKQAQVSSKEGEAQTIVYEGKGKTISQALQKIGNISPKKIYIGHLSFIVVSKDLAERGVEDVLDYLLREPESIKRFYLILARNTKAKNILKIVSPLESFPAQSISTAITFSKESQAISSTIPYSTFVQRLITKGVEPTLPTIELIGDLKDGTSVESLQETSAKTYLQLSDVAIFKGDKLVHITDEEESKGINIINNASEEMLISSNCSGGKAEFELRDSNVKKKISLENGQPVITINARVDASLQESTCKIDLEDNKEILDLQEKANAEIERLIEKAITVSQKYESDIFGFGNLFYKHYPKEYNKVHETWNEEGFKNLKVKTNVKVRLEYKGSIESRIKED